MAGYAAGTLIATEDGALPIEGLGIGHRAVTVSGETKRIKWIWHRSVNPEPATPTNWYWRRTPFDYGTDEGDRFAAQFAPGALADGVPSRRLITSLEQNVYIDTVC